MKLATVKPKIEPQEGDYKIEKKFAWWPRVVEDKKIWLEYYKCVHVYTIRNRCIPMIGSGIIFRGVWGGWDFVTEQLIKQ